MAITIKKIKLCPQKNDIGTESGNTESSNIKYTHVKIQGKWTQADIIHIYYPYGKGNGPMMVWYNLKNNQGNGWVSRKYKNKVK